jgi:hypothetical protein
MKTKTKEIDVMVDKLFLQKFLKGENVSLPVWSQHPNSNGITPIKLVIELPEKTIQLSESQFDEAMDAIGFRGEGKLCSRLREKLFGNNE